MYRAEDILWQAVALMMCSPVREGDEPHRQVSYGNGQVLKVPLQLLHKVSLQTKYLKHASSLQKMIQWSTVATCGFLLRHK